MKSKHLPSHFVAIVVLIFTTFLPYFAYSQAPEGVNYQAIARDDNGNALVNRMVSVRFSILQNNINGTLLYEEQYDMVVTNDFGLFNLIIGDGGNTGSGTLAAFSEIDWGNSTHFLKVEVDAGSGFEDLGTTQLLSVPYALYAKSAGNQLKAGDGIMVRNDSIFNTGDTSNTNEAISRFELINDSILVLNEGNRVDTLDLSVFNDEFVNQNLSLSENGNLRIISITGGNQIQFSIADADSSVTNEIQNLSINANGDSLLLSDGSGIEIADLGFVDDQQLSLSGKVLDLTGSNPSSVDLTAILGIDSLNAVNDTTIRVFENGNSQDIVIRGVTSDTSATNELLDSAKLVLNELQLFQGIDTFRIDLTQFDNVDTDNQQLSRSNDSLFLSGNNPSFVDMAPLLGVDSVKEQNDSVFVYNHLGTIDTLTLTGNPSDTSSTNELVDSMRMNNGVLELYEQGNMLSVNFDTLGSLRRNLLSLRIAQNQRNIDTLQKYFSLDSTLTRANADSIGFVLDSLNRFIALDNDLSAFNERIDSMVLRNDSIVLFEGGTTFGVDLSNLYNSGTDNQGLSLSGDTLSIERGDTVFLRAFADTSQISQLQLMVDQNATTIALDNDTSASNELLTEALIVGDSLRLIEGGDTTYVNFTSFNNSGSDNQQIRFNTSRDSILLEDGGGINIRDIRDSISNNSARIIADSLRLNNALLSATNQENRFEADSILQDADSVRLDNFELKYTTDSTAFTDSINNNSVRIIADSLRLNNALLSATDLENRFEADSILQDADSVRLDNFELKYTTDSTAFTDSINNNSARIIADSLRLNNALLSATDLENRFEADSILQDADSVRLDNFELKYAADSTVFNNDINQNQLELTNQDARIINDSTALANFQLKYATDSTAFSDSISNNSARIIADSLRLNNALLSATDLESRFEADSILQDADSVRLDNFELKYTTDSTAFTDSINNNSARIIADSLRLNNALLSATDLENRFEADSVLQDADSVRLDNFELKYTTDSTAFSDSISNNSARIIADSLRLNNALLTATDLENRFEADSILQDADSVRLDNFELKYAADSTVFSNDINQNQTDISSNSSQLLINRDSIALLSDSMTSYNLRISKNQDSIARVQANISDTATALRGLIGALSAGAYDDSSSTNELVDSLALNNDVLEVYEDGLLSFSLNLDSLGDQERSILQNQITTNQNSITANLNQIGVNRDSIALLSDTLDYFAGVDSVKAINDSIINVIYSDGSFFQYQILGSKDGDTDDRNEAVDSLRLNRFGVLELFEGDALFPVTVDLSSLNNSGTDNQNLTFTNDSIVIDSGAGISLRPILDSMRSNHDSITSYSTRILANESALAADNDGDVTNEIQTLTFNNTNDELTISGVGGNTVDLSSLNNTGTDDQTLSLSSAQQLSIESGNTIDLRVLSDSAISALADTAAEIRSALLDSTNNLRTTINNLTFSDDDNWQDDGASDVLTSRNVGIGSNINFSGGPQSAFAQGSFVSIDGLYGSAIGDNISLSSSADRSSAKGFRINISNVRSHALGSWINITAKDAFVIGGGWDVSNRLLNDKDSSIMFGYGSVTPTMTIEGAKYSTGIGKVGIGVSTPDSLLDVAGGISAEYLRLSGGAQNGYVLTSDANGSASWQALSVPTSTLSDVLLSGNNASFQSIQNLDSIYTEHALFTRFGSTRMSLSNGDTNIYISYFGSGNPMAGIILDLDGTSTTTTEVVGLKSRVSTGNNLYGGFFESNGGESSNIAIYANAINPATSSTNNYAALFDNGKVQINDTLVIPTGAVDGYILTSDALGKASWQNPTSVGDNLGNHTATQNLNLGSFSLVGNGGTSGITINSAGNIGIGGSAQSNRRFYVTTSSDQYAGQFTNTISGQTNTSFGLYANTSGSNPSGVNVGVRGDASGAGQNIAIQGFGPGFGVNNYAAYFQNAKVYMQDSVGIGTTTPTASLDVNGDATIDVLNINNEYTFPSTDGDAGYIIETDGAGNLSWVEKEESTCPTGMVAAGPNMCIETGERGATTWFVATTTCAANGYKLPTWAEWYSGVSLGTGLTNTTDDWEWVDGGTSNTARKVGQGGLQNVANEDPTESSTVTYRCIYYLK